MMSKRGAESQSGREGSFNGDGSGAVQTDAPKQATAAQMAARKIKQLKNRKPGTPGRAASPGAAAVQNPFSSFGDVAPSTSQSFPPAAPQPQQNGGFGASSSFGGFSSGFDFNFNPPGGASAGGFNFAAGGNGLNSQAVSQAPSGGMFNFSGASSNTAPSQPQPSNPFGFVAGNQSSSTNAFGAPPATQSNLFGASTSTAPAFSGFGASTSTAPAFNFASTTSNSTPSNIFGGSTLATQPPAVTSTSTPSAPANIFGASTTQSNPFGLGNQTANSTNSNLFGSATPSAPSTGALGSSTATAPSTIGASNPFASLKSAQPEPKQTPAKPLFSAEKPLQTPDSNAPAFTLGSFTAPQASKSTGSLFGATAAAPLSQTPGPNKPAFSFAAAGSPEPNVPPTTSSNLFGQFKPVNSEAAKSAPPTNSQPVTNGTLTNGDSAKVGAFSFLSADASTQPAAGLFGKPASSDVAPQPAGQSEGKSSAPNFTSPFSKLPRSPEKPKALELPKQTNSAPTTFGNMSTPKPTPSSAQPTPAVNGASVMFGNLSNPPAMTTLTGATPTSSSAQPATTGLFAGFGSSQGAQPPNGVNLGVFKPSTPAEKPASTPFTGFGTPSQSASATNASTQPQPKPAFAFPASTQQASTETSSSTANLVSKLNEKQKQSFNAQLKLRELNAALVAYLTKQNGVEDFSDVLLAYKEKVAEITSKKAEAPQSFTTAPVASPFKSSSTSSEPSVNGTVSKTPVTKRKADSEATPSPKKSKNEQATSPTRGSASKTADVMQRLFNDFDASKTSTSPSTGQDKPSATSTETPSSLPAPPKFNVGKTSFMAQFAKRAVTDDSDSDDDEPKSRAPPPKLANMPTFNATPSNFFASFANAAKALQDDSDTESDSDSESENVKKTKAPNADTPTSNGKDEVSDVPATSRQASLAPSNPLFVSSRNPSPTPSTAGGASVFDSPQTSGAFNNPFAKYSPAPSGDGDNDRDSDDEDGAEGGRPSENAGKSLFDRVSRDNEGAISSADRSTDSTPLKPSPAGDRTWNPNTPIKFANAAASASTTPSLFGFTSTTPSPAKPLFGNTLPTFNFNTATPPATDSENKENANSETPKPLFAPSGPSSSNIFGSATKSTASNSATSFLNPNGPSIFSSANTSRASTPGATTDGGDSGAEDSSGRDLTQDESEGAHEDYRTALTETELAENNVLFETLKAKATKLVGGKYAEVGTGPVRLLQSKADGKARVLMRKLNGSVAINSHLLGNGRYAVEPRKPNTAWASFFDEGKPVSFYFTFAKGAVSEAKEFAELCEKNKPAAS